MCQYGMDDQTLTDFRANKVALLAAKLLCEIEFADTAEVSA